MQRFVSRSLCTLIAALTGAAEALREAFDVHFDRRDFESAYGE